MVGVRTWRPDDGAHEASIRIGTVGRYRGVEPRSKVSMMIMRPPQQGQGCESACGPLWPLLLLVRADSAKSRWISCPISMTSSAFSSLLPKNSRVPLVKTALGAIA